MARCRGFEAPELVFTVWLFLHLLADMEHHLCQYCVPPQQLSRFAIKMSEGHPWMTLKLHEIGSSAQTPPLSRAHDLFDIYISRRRGIALVNYGHVHRSDEKEWWLDAGKARPAKRLTGRQMHDEEVEKALLPQQRPAVDRHLIPPSWLWS